MSAWEHVNICDQSSSLGILKAGHGVSINSSIAAVSSWNRKSDTVGFHALEGGGAEQLAHINSDNCLVDLKQAD